MTHRSRVDIAILLSLGVGCTVVPDSATGQLLGLAGTMTIQIADGEHSYEFEYTLSAIQ